MKPEEIEDALLNMARDQGAAYPTFAHSSDDKPVILDTDSGRTWAVELREF